MNRPVNWRAPFSPLAKRIRRQSQPRILEADEAFSLGYKLYEQQAQPIWFDRDSLHPLVAEVLQRDLPLDNGGRVFRYQPLPLRASVVDNVEIVRQADNWATRFIFVRGQEIIGPLIRDNGTRLHSPKHAVKAAQSQHKYAEDQILRVEFAVSLLETGHNFGHLLLSHAPKLRHWIRSGKFSPDGPSVLLGNPEEWQYDVLESIGVPRSKIVSVKNNIARIVVNRFVMTDEKYLGGRSPSFALENFEWIRSAFLGLNQSGLQASPIYLEREPTARRVVLNSEHVRDAVRRAGGVTLQPIKLSVRDKVSAVKRHNTIVVTNGTEMLLSVFASGARVLSIVPPGPHMYGVMSAVALAAGNQVFPLVCVNSFDPEVPADFRDMIVDIEGLEQALAAA